jgi:hypothetical protein
MNPLLQNREILADQPRLQRALGNSKFCWFQIRAEFERLYA